MKEHLAMGKPRYVIVADSPGDEQAINQSNGLSPFNPGSGWKRRCGDGGLGGSRWWVTGDILFIARRGEFLEIATTTYSPGSVASPEKHATMPGIKVAESRHPDGSGISQLAEGANSRVALNQSWPRGRARVRASLGGHHISRGNSDKTELRARRRLRRG